MKVKVNLSNQTLEYMDSQPYIQGTDTRNKLDVYIEHSSVPQTEGAFNIMIAYALQNGRTTIKMANTGATQETIDETLYDVYYFTAPKVLTSISGNFVATLILKVNTNTYKVNVLNTVLNAVDFEAFEDALDGTASEVLESLESMAEDITYLQSQVVGVLHNTDIVDNDDSDDPTKVLSARMGKVLAERIGATTSGLVSATYNESTGVLTLTYENDDTYEMKIGLDATDIQAMSDDVLNDVNDDLTLYKNQVNAEITAQNNAIASINQPKYYNTSSLPTSDVGLVVGSDGYIYSWDSGNNEYVSTGILYQATQTATEIFTYSSFSQLAQQNKQASYYVSASQLSSITDAGALVTATGGVVVNVYNNAFNGNQYVLMLATDQVNRTYYALYNITGAVNTAWKDTEVIKYNNSWNTETFETIATGTLMRVIRKKNSHYTTLSNIGDLADAVGDITVIFIPMVYGGQYGLFIAYDQVFNEYCAIYNYAGVINTKFYKVRETRIGKSLSVFGDSISAQSYYTSPLQNVYRYGIGNKNYAVSGTSYSNLSVAGKIADQITNASTSVDFVLIFAGTNDFALDCPLGTESDNDYTTFYGALNQTFIALRTKYPTKSIFCSTILQRNTTIYADQPQGMINNIGLSVDDYNTAIKKVAKRYGCFIIDSYNESGIVKDINLSTYTQDGLHPNTDGGLRLAKLFDSYFKTKPIY